MVFIFKDLYILEMISPIRMFDNVSRYLVAVLGGGIYILEKNKDPRKGVIFGGRFIYLWIISKVTDSICEYAPKN